MNTSWKTSIGQVHEHYMNIGQVYVHEHRSGASTSLAGTRSGNMNTSLITKLTTLLLVPQS